VVNHYNTQPVSDVYAAVDDRDLGGVASDVDRVVAEMAPSLPKGTHIVARGQVASMRSSFVGLGLGVLFAMVLVYLLLVINFQSWLDPLVIVMGLPGALCGIVWMLFVTQTTFNVPSLMGSIMSLGVATANSVLLITFADDLRREGRSALEAALEAGSVRLRPVCMTALAMIIGMLPMALGLGEGGEQNAPLGRAVIGGLLVATCFTLVVVRCYTASCASHRLHHRSFSRRDTHERRTGNRGTAPRQEGPSATRRHIVATAGGQMARGRDRRGRGGGVPADGDRAAGGAAAPALGRRHRRRCHPAQRERGDGDL